VILGLDTASAATAVALMGSDGEAMEARDDPPEGVRPNHASRLLGLIEEVLAVSGVGWPDISRLAVGVGPGGFTGLRIGIATARALAQAQRLPVVPVSSLAALALGAEVPGRMVVPVLDARRGEVFVAAYLDGREMSLAPAVTAPEQLAEHLRRVGENALAVGDGAVRYRAELEALGAEVPPAGASVHRIAAAQVCRLGADGEPAGFDALLPHYIREPDAVPRPR
jgi:tRNA threonylcarbamoyladenosine biosynthesis protein TsaB